MTRLEALSAAVASCDRCRRLVDWRTQVAKNPPARHRGDAYWAKAVPGIGDGDAGLLVLGLAPGAHGANRTGRPFNGDASGGWLWAALERFGFVVDGRLVGCWVTNAVKCVPPDNRPTAGELSACSEWLAREAAAVKPKVVVCLGGIAWYAACRQWSAQTRPRPPFFHGAEHRAGGITLLGSYHPSRQNTNTGRLRIEQFDAVFARARQILELEHLH